MPRSANRVFSGEFVKKFKNALIKTYDYKEFMDFLIVPSIFGSKTLAYLPLLSYTDKQKDELDPMLNIAKDTNYLINILNFDTKEFTKHDQVTMRLYIDAKKSLIEHYKTRDRQQIRKALKHGYIMKEGVEFLDDFFMILRKNYQKHGFPLIPKVFFKNIAEVYGDDFHLFVLYKDNMAAAAKIALRDKELVWFPWAGVNPIFVKEYAGPAMYHLAIEKMVEDYHCEIIDFGRSSYNEGTYHFKQKFGAIPIKIDIIKPFEENIYKKYRLASQVYKALPFWITDRLGPFLIKHLADA